MKNCTGSSQIHAKNSTFSFLEKRMVFVHGVDRRRYKDWHDSFGDKEGENNDAATEELRRSSTEALNKSLKTRRFSLIQKIQQMLGMNGNSPKTQKTSIPLKDDHFSFHSEEPSGTSVPKKEQPTSPKPNPAVQPAASSARPAPKRADANSKNPTTHADGYYRTPKGKEGEPQTVPTAFKTTALQVANKIKEEKERVKQVIPYNPEAIGPNEKIENITNAASFANAIERINQDKNPKKKNITFELGGGNYPGHFHTLRHVNNIIIKPKDPSNPPVFTGNGEKRPFFIEGKNIRLEGLRFKDITSDVAIRIAADNAHVKNCTFTNIKTAINTTGENSTIEGNTILQYSQDGIMVGSDGATIKNNRIEQYTGIHSDKDAHSDAIQLYYDGDKNDRFYNAKELRNITITENTIDGTSRYNGANNPTQGILASQVIITNGLITNNNIKVGSVHGISGAFIGSYIGNNSVSSVAGAEKPAEIRIQPYRRARDGEDGKPRYVLIDSTGNPINYSVALENNTGKQNVHSEYMPDRPIPASVQQNTTPVAKTSQNPTKKAQAAAVQNRTASEQVISANERNTNQPKWNTNINLSFDDGPAITSGADADILKQALDNGIENITFYWNAARFLNPDVLKKFKITTNHVTTQKGFDREAFLNYIASNLENDPESILHPHAKKIANRMKKVLPPEAKLSDYIGFHGFFNNNNKSEEHLSKISGKKVQQEIAMHEMIIRYLFDDNSYSLTKAKPADGVGVENLKQKVAMDSVNWVGIGISSKDYSTQTTLEDETPRMKDLIQQNGDRQNQLTLHSFAYHTDESRKNLQQFYDALAGKRGTQKRTIPAPAPQNKRVTAVPTMQNERTASSSNALPSHIENENDMLSELQKPGAGVDTEQGQQLAILWAKKYFGAKRAPRITQKSKGVITLEADGSDLSVVITNRTISIHAKKTGNNILGVYTAEEIARLENFVNHGSMYMQQVKDFFKNHQKLNKYTVEGVSGNNTLNVSKKVSGKTMHQSLTFNEDTVVLSFISNNTPVLSSTPEKQGGKILVAMADFMSENYFNIVLRPEPSSEYRAKLYKTLLEPPESSKPITEFVDPKKVELIKAQIPRGKPPKEVIAFDGIFGDDRENPKAIAAFNAVIQKVFG